MGFARDFGRLERCWTRWSVQWSKLSAHLSESIGGLRTVKAFAQEDREARRFCARNEEVIASRLREDGKRAGPVCQIVEENLMHLLRTAG